MCTSCGLILATALWITCHFTDEEPEAKRLSTFLQVIQVVRSGAGILIQVCQTPGAMLFTMLPCSGDQSSLWRRLEGGSLMDGGRGGVKESPGNGLK